MRAFIAKGTDMFHSDEIITEGSYLAFYGFSLMGWEIEFYKDDPPEGLSRNDVVVGWITQVKMAIRNLGIEPPDELDYPEELRGYLGRKIWKSTLHKIYGDHTTWPVFVKPVKGKQFTGKLIEGLGDLVGLGGQDDRDIWCSTPMNFISEWRCFVRYGQLIDVRCYKGNFMEHPNYNVVRNMIKDYTSQPAAYTVDVGVIMLARTPQTWLIEVNDGYACGSYGLNYTNYVKMISARWCEMVDIPDIIQF